MNFQVVIILSISTATVPVYRGYTFPRWSVVLGWCLAFSSVSAVPIVAIYTWFAGHNKQPTRPSSSAKSPRRKPPLQLDNIAGEGHHQHHHHHNQQQPQCSSSPSCKEKLRLMANERADTIQCKAMAVSYSQPGQCASGSTTTTTVLSPMRHRCQSQKQSELSDKTSFPQNVMSEEML